MGSLRRGGSHEEGGVGRAVTGYRGIGAKRARPSHRLLPVLLLCVALRMDTTNAVLMVVSSYAPPKNLLALRHTSLETRPPSSHPTTHRLLQLCHEQQRLPQSLVESSPVPKLRSCCFERCCCLQARVEFVELLLPLRETFAEKLESGASFNEPLRVGNASVVACRKDEERGYLVDCEKEEVSASSKERSGEPTLATFDDGEMSLGVV